MSIINGGVNGQKHNRANNRMVNCGHYRSREKILDKTCHLVIRIKMLKRRLVMWQVTPECLKCQIFLRGLKHTAMIIKEWNFEKPFGGKFKVKLTEKDLRVINKNSIFSGKYTFNSFFEKRYPIISIDADYEIIQEILKLPKPEKLSDLADKSWKFWTYLKDEVVEDEKIFIDNINFLLKAKNGFALGHHYQKDEHLYLFQLLDNFFFFGPKLHSIPLDVRVRLRNEILDRLDRKERDYFKQQAFIIFDYNKIPPIEYEFKERIRGEYFKIIDGKVTVRGWDNPRDGGEFNTSVEDLWYNINSIIQKEFHDKIDIVKDMLKSAIVKL